jgi:DNA adenine methylase
MEPDRGIDLPKTRPFLRWAGSKRKQLVRLSAFWSNNHSAYVEPFAGSACLFFALSPKAAVLGDANAELIELFTMVRDSPNRLYNRLVHIPRDLETYYRWRARDPHSLDAETRALRFLYLNRNCFNGIYRTNASGQFNVPMGTKLSAYFHRSVSFDAQNCSRTLSSSLAILPPRFLT